MARMQAAPLKQTSLDGPNNNRPQQQATGNSNRPQATGNRPQQQGSEGAPAAMQSFAADAANRIAAKRDSGSKVSSMTALWLTQPPNLLAHVQLLHCA